MPDGPPNILLVVLDCMRAADFPGPGDLPESSWLGRLMSRSTWYPRAITTAPWTIPAHVSLFTGQYPWHHGAHARGGLRMSGRLETLGQLLGNQGYSTFALSANPLIEPTFNLTQGFERMAWSAWWESFLRIPRAPRVGVRPAAADPAPGSGTARRGGAVDRLLHDRMDDAFRYTFLMDGANRLAQRLRPPSPGMELAVGSWIEPTLADWVNQTDPNVPVFAFVNLVEAHEPYFRNDAVSRGLRSWWRFAQCRQDYVGFLNGDWSPDPERMALLHELYRAQVAVIERRLAGLVQALDRAGRWDNTLLVVTSDHGQAFGEHEMLFHMIRPDESLLRIPLIVRFPGQATSRVVDRWVSLIDVAPTVLRAAGAPTPEGMDGVALQEVDGAPRAGPLLAGCDGVVWDHQKSRFSAERMRLLDHVRGIAYEGSWKVIVDLTEQTTTAFDVVLDPNERTDRWDAADPVLARLASSARDAANGLAQASSPEMTTDVEERLKSWGYV